MLSFFIITILALLIIFFWRNKFKCEEDFVGKLNNIKNKDISDYKRTSKVLKSYISTNNLMEFKKELIRFEKRNRNIIDRHFLYEYLIKETINNDEFLETCEEICIIDVSIFDKFKREWLISEYKNFSLKSNKNDRLDFPKLEKLESTIFNPIILEVDYISFNTLINIYEQKNEIAKAIFICYQAIIKGLDYNKEFKEKLKELKNSDLSLGMIKSENIKEENEKPSFINNSIYRR